VAVEHTLAKANDGNADRGPVLNVSKSTDQSIVRLVLRCLGLPWLEHQSDNRLVGALAHIQNRPSISIAIVGLGQGVLHSHPASQGYHFRSLPVFDSIPELCNSSGPLILTKVS